MSDEVGCTDLVSHENDASESTKLIKIPPHRLGVEKDQEVERQVEDLVKWELVKTLIGPGASQLSSTQGPILVALYLSQTVK